MSIPAVHTGSAPFNASMNKVKTAARVPATRKTLVHPIFPLPVVRGSGAPVQRANTSPKGIVPMIYAVATIAKPISGDVMGRCSPRGRGTQRTAVLDGVTTRREDRQRGGGEKQTETERVRPGRQYGFEDQDQDGDRLRDHFQLAQAFRGEHASARRGHGAA